MYCYTNSEPTTEKSNIKMFKEEFCRLLLFPTTRNVQDHFKAMLKKNCNNNILFLEYCPGRSTVLVKKKTLFAYRLIWRHVRK